MLVIAALALLVGAAIGALRGGNLSNLLNLRIRHSWLVAAAFAAQAAMFSTPLQFMLGGYVAPILVASNLAVVAFVALNWHLPGLKAFGVGLVANSLVMLLNGGFMPVSESAMNAAGMGWRVSELRALGHNDKSILMDAETRLPMLGDVIPAPGAERVISVGDLLIGAGVTWLVAAGMARPPTLSVAQAPATVQETRG